MWSVKKVVSVMGRSKRTPLRRRGDAITSPHHHVSGTSVLTWRRLVGTITAPFPIDIAKDADHPNEKGRYDIPHHPQDAQRRGCRCVLSACRSRFVRLFFLFPSIGNGERGMGNGEEGTGNGERGMGNNCQTVKPSNC